MRARHCVSTRMPHEQDKPDLSLLWQAFQSHWGDSEIHKKTHIRYVESTPQGGQEQYVQRPWGRSMCGEKYGVEHSSATKIICFYSEEGLG